MRRTLLVLLSLALAPALVHGQATFRFIQNRGQWPAAVTHRADIAGATVWCERGSVVIDRYDAPALQALYHAHSGQPGEPGEPIIRHHALRLRFLNAREAPEVLSQGIQPGAYNYLLGNDPKRWAGNAHAFSSVVQRGLYPGVDLRIRGGDTGLKYDLILAPESDPRAILFTYEGSDGLVIGPERLLVRTSLGDLVETIPLAYQEVDGTRIPVTCRYRAVSGQVGFELGPHDLSLPVVIDPTLSFSTYSGSFANNFGYTATFDSDGFLYSGSSAFGQNYPTTTGAYQVMHAGGDGLFDGTDIALTKYDTSGTYLIWSTYLGGSSDELPHSLVVNGNDELFVYGTTSSNNFPVTPGAIDFNFNGGPAVNLTNGLGANYPNGVDMIVARLSADGSQLLAGTYLGGTNTDGLNTAPGLTFNYADEVRGEILLDVNENVYIASCTSSPDMPTSPGSFQPGYGGGTHDGVVLKLDATLTTIIWSTFFGGSLADALYSVELDDTGRLYVAGGTRSTDLPVTTGVLTPTFQGGTADGFVAELSADGSGLVASTYFGTASYDQCYFADLDQDGFVYLFGQTQAPGTELIFNAPYNVPNSGQFIAKLDAGLTTLLIGSRFGQGDGTPDISPTAFLVDYCDKIYVSGWGSAIQGGTLSTSGMTVTPDGYQLSTDGNDFYLAVFDIDMSSLFYGTYFGGNISAEHVDGGTSRFDRRGRVYQSVCAGCGGNSDFPIQPNPGAWSATNNSGFCNNGVFKFDFDFPIVVAGFNSTLNCLPQPIQFNNTSYGATNYFWSFGDGSFSASTSPSHLYAGPGVYTVTLIASNAATCNQSDTLSQQVVVLGAGTYQLPDTSICLGGTVQIGVLPIPEPGITYQWSPLTGLSNPNIANPFCSPAQTTTYSLTISNGLCTSVATQTVAVGTDVIDAGAPQSICGPSASAFLVANGFGSVGLFQWSSNAAFTDTLNAPLTDSTATVLVTTSAWYFVQPLGNACGGVDSVFIQVELAAPAILGDLLICADQETALQLTGVEPGSNISWSPAGQIDSGQGTAAVVVSPASSTVFSVNVTSPSGCTWSGSATVSVSTVNSAEVNATVDQPIVIAGTTVQLQAAPATGVTYTWSPSGAVSNSGIADPTAVVNETTTFVVVVSDSICTVLDSVTVRVFEFLCDEPDIFVPNAFTPNGDGNNDLLFVRGRYITALEFKIFDRWGEKVFETTDQRFGWDAIFNGKPVDPAVFVYWLKVDCEGGQTYFKKGNVTVIR
jgi:gliding motility-associated-like protein